MRAATAKISAQLVAHLRFGGFRYALQKRRGLHDHAVNAVATLHRLLIDEGLLQGMQPLRRTQPFKRRDIALDPADWINARANRAAVQMHGAGPALAQSATKARPVQLQIISEEVEQRHRRIVAVRDDLFAVHVELELRHALDLGRYA